MTKKNEIAAKTRRHQESQKGKKSLVDLEETFSGNEYPAYGLMIYFASWCLGG
jgi:hypothetical protein